jgi:hypothetical protein
MVSPASTPEEGGGALVDEDLVRGRGSAVREAGDLGVRAEGAGCGDVEFDHDDPRDGGVLLWRFQRCADGGGGQQPVDAVDSCGLHGRGDRCEVSALGGGEGDVDRAVLGPRGVGEGAFDHVTDDERGGDDGCPEQRAGDDETRLRAAALDVAQGHGDQRRLAEGRHGEREEQEQREDCEDGGGGHDVTVAMAWSSRGVDSTSPATVPSRTSTRR